MELHTTHPEWIVEILMGSSDVTIEIKLRTSNLGIGIDLPFGSETTGWPQYRRSGDAEIIGPEIGVGASMTAGSLAIKSRCSLMARTRRSSNGQVRAGRRELLLAP